ncbi:MAG: dihydropteroate synthase [Verrucomicrobiae bacterium]|nr:dihydropteroate synthase [Verrucomicrobiae bacterium]
MFFRARQFEFVFPRPALVMGIVNVTPDSFSDGGKFFKTAAAVAHGLTLAAQGAEILDIGGESTRPGAVPVSEAEELRRVIPVIEQLAAETKAVLSIDTLKPAVARAALAAGAGIVNDVGAGRDERDDRAMWRAVAAAGAGYICMHAQGPPATMQKNPVYADVVGEVAAFFRERLEKLNAAGVAADQVVFDPGIGFGKTLEHNLQLLAGLERFVTLNRPVLLGVSRKSFLEKFSGAGLNERLPASLACATLAIGDGVQIIRTHDAGETVQAIRIAEAILNRKQDA